MDEDQYILTQHQITILAQLLLPLDLKGFLEAIDRAETTGPIVDPTLFHRAMDSMKEIKTVASALRRAQVEIQKLLPDELVAMIPPTGGAGKGVSDHG